MDIDKNARLTPRAESGSPSAERADAEDRRMSGRASANGPRLADLARERCIACLRATIADERQAGEADERHRPGRGLGRADRAGSHDLPAPLMLKAVLAVEACRPPRSMMSPLLHSTAPWRPIPTTCPALLTP